MIRFIKAEDTLAIRSQVLQKGKDPQLCLNPEDNNPDSFHLGYFDDQDKLVCILTIHKTSHPKLPHTGYRLRGMATLPEGRRKGYANQLLNAAIEHLKTQLHADYLWFNARKVAYAFYESMGFEYMSDEFEIADIGPHKEMFMQF